MLSPSTSGSLMMKPLPPPRSTRLDNTWDTVPVVYKGDNCPYDRLDAYTHFCMYDMMNELYQKRPGDRTVYRAGFIENWIQEREPYEWQDIYKDLMDNHVFIPYSDSSLGYQFHPYIVQIKDDEIQNLCKQTVTVVLIGIALTVFMCFVVYFLLGLS